MADKTLYEYAVVKQEKKDKQTGDVTDPAAILIPPTYVLAASEEEVNILAARAIPEEEIANIDRVQTVVRPF